MAVTPPKKPPVQLIRTYMPTLKRQMLMTIVLPAVLISLIIALLLAMTGAVPAGSHALWSIPLCAGLLIASSNMLIFVITSSPLQEIMKALAHVSGEPVPTPVPNPNDPRLIKNGLAPAVQLIYSLDHANGTATSAVNPDAPILSADALTGRMHGALVALDATGAITYASAHAPIETPNGGQARLRLLFHEQDALATWVTSSSQSTVKAEHIWRRVPDRPSDQEDQRLYDVFASYEKGAAHETIVLLVDQTEVYQVDEEDLNFIAFAAHELRGPITVIRGYLDVLQDELAQSLSGDQHELFTRLSVSTSRLSGYINNILNTSRYDRRHLSMSLAQDSFAAIYATIADDMQLRASSQNRLLSVLIDPNLPAIAADRSSLSEVIGNLIDNAIKYSNEGGAISVTAQQSGDFVALCVEDHGIGMPASVVKNLFQKFYRSHRSRETIAGSGIGLYISKAIVESHGGTISVTSTDGAGSTFTVAIPTYASVADKLVAGNNSNLGLISHGAGWIKNHSMYRG